MITFNVYNLLPLISSAAFFLLGFFIYLKNKNSKVNFSFLLVCLVTFWWQFSWFILFSSDNEIFASYLVRIGYIGIIFIPVIFFHFFINLLNIKDRFDVYLVYLAYFVGAIFSFLDLFTNLFIEGFYKYFWGYYPKAGILHPIYLILLFLLSARILYLLYINLKDSRLSNTYKYSQLKFVLVALIFYLFSACDFIVNYGYEFYPFGFIFILIFLGIFGYTIIAYRLMDVKLVMRRYSVHLASLGTILIAAVIVKYFIEIYYFNYSIWFDLIILIVSISTYPTVKNYFYRVANKYFFSSLYDSSEVIATLSEKLRSTLEAEKIYEYIYQTLSNAFHVKAFGLLTHSEENKSFFVQYNKGFNVDSQIFLKDEQLDKMFIKQNKIVVTEEVKRLGSFEKNSTVDLLLKLKVEILAPLNVKNKTIGLIALGPKESGDMYNEEDLKVLEVVGAQAAISLENALLYKETKNFNIKLEKEVEKATRDLRKANTQLKKLDAAKSEFISIASHQLRTPLTVIKGYISMMIEGNFGALTKLETESLEKVFTSNERLIQLVENLLNISRIESGRLQFDFHEVDLNEMTESVIDELSGNAKKKGLILQYKAPVQPLPKIKIDDEKIRQVVMNLIDNAIKYTKQGSVTVKLEQIGKKIKFSVADSGMGIRPEDMVNLFKKFSRGTGTSLVHTEGTGLGLYVARMMISAHKGKIWAESDGEGKGSKFCFELPAK
jgi:signal transduction histidine kinase